MSTTVLEALQGAQINFDNVAKMSMGLVRHPIFVLATEQLKNGIAALENGKSPNEIIQEDMLSEVDTGGEVKK